MISGCSEQFRGALDSLGKWLAAKVWLKWGQEKREKELQAANKEKLIMEERWGIVSAVSLSSKFTHKIEERSRSVKSLSNQ